MIGEGSIDVLAARLLRSRPSMREPASPAPGDQAAGVELSIVMPCLDEAETVGTCVAKAREFLRLHEISGEVVVADNGSRDGSREIAEAAGARVVAVEARGYGSALLGGMTAARGRFLVMGDADDSYDFSALMPFLDKLRAGCDVVIGNRFLGGIEPGAMPALHRYLGTPVLTRIGRLFYGAKIGDSQCGLRALRREALAALGLRTTGMEFASEMIVKASLLGLRIEEVPTTLARDGRSRPPHLRSFRDGWRHLRFLLLYSPRWLFLYPGAALMLAGAAVGAWLLPGPRMVGGVRLDIHTLFYAALAVLIGFQAVAFAVLTKTFAMAEGLLPSDARFDRAARLFTLEVGLTVGLTLVAAGIGGSVYAVRSWSEVAFGDLEPRQTLRTIIPAGTALALGLQVALSSFFASVLGLRRR